MKKTFLTGIYFLAITALFLSFFYGCKNDTGPNSPYVGSPGLKNITIGKGTFKPSVFWEGGYVSVFGVNRGEKVVLDTTLIWLIYQKSNSIHYPVAYGTLPQGGQDLTVNYGGTTLDSLIEDNKYTYWVMKEDVWEQISAIAKGKLLLTDSSIAFGYKIAGDTVKISSKSFTQSTQQTDLFVNIKNITLFGRLADIFIQQPKVNSNIKVSWKIKQSGVTDSLIAAIGVSEGVQYNDLSLLWEVYSLDIESGKEVYGKSNIIQPNISIGQNMQGTKVFVEFPSTGLTKGKDYYIWIANNKWDQTSRTRSASYYAYATFHVY